MSDLPSSLFANPAWHALQTKHRHLAVSGRDACRYPAELAPFAAVAAPTSVSLQQLYALLAPHESVWLVGEGYPPVPELSFEGTLECLQMVLPEGVAPPDPAIEIVSLSDANAGEMVVLTDLAFPGFFRQRTCEMGSYYGVRSDDGALIAMGGGRLKLGGFTEISGVCTHQSFRGRGLAAEIIWEVVREHRNQGVVSWLHVASANQRAAKLYLRMGFKEIRNVRLHRVTRKN